MPEPLDLVDVEQVPDVLAELWGHPHFNHGCDLVLEVSRSGVVYCADCASTIGFVGPQHAGLKVGQSGKARRWLSHDEIIKAWSAGDK